MELLKYNYKHLNGSLCVCGNMHLTFQKTYYTCVLNALLLYHSKLHPPNITKQNKSHYEQKSHTSVFNSLTVTRKVSLAGVGSDLISPTILSKTHRRDVGVFFLSLRPIRGAKSAILFDAERSRDLSASNRTDRRSCPDRSDLAACGACRDRRISGHVT